MQMTLEMQTLAWTLVLALAQIFLTAAFRTRETGLTYNMSARDLPAPPPGKITARLMRAQSNLFETLPLFAAALLIAHVTGHEGPLTLSGAWIYLLARIVYIPVYAAGIPVLRSLIWAASLAGLIRILCAILMPA